MKVMIMYPHGLGDCLLLTPAIKELKAISDITIGLAMLQRFKSSNIFDHNHCLDEIIYTADAWNEFPSFQIGCQEVFSYCEWIGKQRGYNMIAPIYHSQNNSKIVDCFTALNVPLKNPHTEIYTTDEDKAFALDFTKDLGDFGFIHTSTGVPAKDLPEGYGEKWLRENKGLTSFVEVGKTFKYDEFDINKQFEIMRLAKAVCLPDSVFYHACHAMDKEVDFVYFARGKQVYDRVKPLHEVKENVNYELT
jgi:hypothetical protein